MATYMYQYSLYMHPLAAAAIVYSLIFKKQEVLVNEVILCRQTNWTSAVALVCSALSYTVILCRVSIVRDRILGCCDHFPVIAQSDDTLPS